MVKAIAASIIIVCLVGSTAMGSLLNEQNWVFALGETATPNSLHLSGAAGGATQTSGIGTLIGQGSTSAQDGTSAFQGAGTGLLQTASGVNFGASTIVVEQAAASVGVEANGHEGQSQEIQQGTNGLLTQSEGASLLGAQAIQKTGGAGTASALNGTGVVMGQFGANAAQGATVAQGSLMIGASSSRVGGARGSSVSTYANMTGTVLQAQQIN